MAETLVNWFISTFDFLITSELGKSLLVFIISLLPILELRGGLIAASILKLGIAKSFIITFIGTILPVPFILLFIKKVIEWMGKTKKLKKIAVDITKENIDNIVMETLSMGMTGDYPIAVSEGATYVRVGTGIFGER